MSTIMFALVGNINFLYDIKGYDSFFISCLTVIDDSLGNFDFNIFKSLDDSGMEFFGKIYLIFIVITFDLLLLNLLLAILSNTYSIFETKSNGLYLSQILSSRDEMVYDPYYGAFLSGMPPLNIISFPFIPVSFYFRYG